MAKAAFDAPRRAGFLLWVPALLVLAAAPWGVRAQSRPDTTQTAAAIHVLNRLGFGPRPGDVERVQRLGLEAYIAQQLKPEALPDTGMAARLAPFSTLTMSTAQLADEYFEPARLARMRAQQSAGAQAGTAPMAGEPVAPRRTPEQAEAALAERAVMLNLQQQKLLRAVYSERQLEEVLVDFWFNHFNVFAGKGQVRIYLTEYERDTIRPRVLGPFRDLLGAVAESPAMLFYLDNWQSSAPMEPRARGRIGRPMPPRRPTGVNENYARELMELHTLGVDGGYTQKDVQEVARAFTGWTIQNVRQGGGFVFNPRMHDDGEKIVLGKRLAAGGGRRDGEQVLDLLAAHPSTARFIATKLARRFVADDPPAALVARAAATFTATGGNLREVVRTIVTSPEFLAPAARRAKTKTPFEFVASAVRATGVEMTSALPLAQAARDLGMPLYGAQPPTGYADRAEAWVNTGALLGRMNFAVALTSGTLRGGGRRAGEQPARAARSLDVERLPDIILNDVLGGVVAATTQTTVGRAEQPAQVAALLLGSPDFQKR